MDGRFAGKVALVTGATSGIGQATAVRLAGEGAIVAVNRRPTGDLTETLRRIEAVGGQGFPVVADMRSPAQIIDMVREVAHQAGRLDLIVSNAGINPVLRWDETTLEDFDRMFETNVRGYWVVSTEGAKQMIREGHGGAICMVSSISAHVGSPGATLYCGAKGAISMLSKALGCVLGEHGIRVNAVEPGWIKTPMSAAVVSYPEILKYYEERVALHRGGEAEEVASAIAFLLSDDASYATAATLLLDGGYVVNAGM